LDGLRDPVPAREPARHPASPPVFHGPPHRSIHRKFLWTASALAAAAVILVGVFIRSPANETFVGTAITEIGALRQLPLPDGSIVHLNTDTAVDIHFSSTERLVRLTRGEAFFAVARHPTRPFRVEAGAISVRAVGTAFNVRWRADAVEVLVTEGKVSVNPAESSPTETATNPSAVLSSITFDPRVLTAGEKAIVSAAVDDRKAAEPLMIAKLDPLRIESALAWQARRLEFSETPLSEVVAEFNRYNRQRVVIADPALGAVSFGGAFRSDGYESLVEVLEQSFNVVAERREEETILRLRR
jgi:transmembrane sensor